MISDIPQDERVYRKLVQRASLRMQRSAMWSDQARQEWVRMYKWWRKIVDDDQYDTDDYQIFLGYAFGLVEQLNSKITEPLLQMGLPYAVQPDEFGDGRKADNFAQVARNWYTKPHNQNGIRRSKKEMIITGNRWEIDEWADVRSRGRMWGKKLVRVVQPMMRGDGTPVIGGDGKPVTGEVVVPVDAEVERMIVRHYGFSTRYPSVFNMHPEPERKTIGTGQPTDVSWLVEDMGELALEDLARETVYDVDTRNNVPKYDFGRLLHDAGSAAEARYKRILDGGDPAEDKYGPLVIPNREWPPDSDWGRVNRDTLYPAGSRAGQSSSEDRDKVWVVREYGEDEITTIAQGRYIIHRKRSPYHVPGIKARIENYTQDPEFIYGPGAIKAVEDELGELNDIRTMTMQNFFRLVNKMLYIREDAIVSMDDFKPRAGGKVRISQSVGDIRSAVQDGNQGNVVNEMLAAESNERGMIEFISSNMDGSPGVQGTKQMHKTKGGLEIIQLNTNTRFITMQAHALINEALRGISMQDMFAQFAFEKRPYRLQRDDGSTTYAKFNKDDVDTQGRGFNFAIEVDPLWGNTVYQREDAQQVFSLAMEYEQLRRTVKDPSMPKANLGKLFEDLLKKHGRRDTSAIFAPADGSMDPDDELQVLISGGSPQCQGDLVHHIKVHIAQRGSPALKAAVEAGKAAPDTLQKLDLLIEQSMARLVTFVKDPVGQTKAAMASAMSKEGPGVDGDE